MKDKWEQLYALSTAIEGKMCEKWMMEITQLLTEFVEDVLAIVDENVKITIIQELNDIMSAMNNRDIILLEDSIRYGLLDSTKGYYL